jgi:hypothetical protein
MLIKKATNNKKIINQQEKEDFQLVLTAILK